MWNVLLFVVIACSADDVTDGTTLMQTFLVHRHGDRTPVEESLAFTSNPDAVAAASAKYGYGQLTELGKQRAFKLGQHIRRRYSCLLPSQYNRSDIYLRSTDSTRTKMTILAAMAATFPPPRDNWNKRIAWTPVPYTTVPVKYDFNLASINCPTFMASYVTALYESPPSMEQYSDVIDALAEISGIDEVKSMPVLAYPFYDAFVSQEHLGVPLDEKIKRLMPRLKEAAGAAIAVMFDPEQSKYMAGVLLNEFFKYASSVVAGDSTPRVRIYSAHDVNVFAFMVASKVPSQGVPPYASSLTLELRKVKTTGQYVVLPVYKSDPCAEPLYLKVEGCSLLCDLEQFRELVVDSLLDEKTWRTDCGFTEDLVIDDSSIN